MWKKRSPFVYFILVFIILAATPLFNYSEKESKKKPRYGGTVRVKAFTNIFRRQLDPASPDSYVFVSEQLYDGLVRLDKNLTLVPSLAEYWKISADGKTYTFYLRKGVKFHHGKELSTEDVKFSLERLIRKETESPYFHFFTARVAGALAYREGKTKEVTGFRIKDKYIFEIQLIKPYVSALYLMSMSFCKILPRDQMISQGRGFFLKPSGTGAFKFSYWMRSPQLDIVGIRLERNDQYFEGRPYLDALEFSPYFTLQHFLDKEIDIIPVLSERLFRANCQIFKDGSFNLIFLGMSCNVNPLNSKIVRKAIVHAVNKGEIARASFDLKYIPEVTNSYIPPKFPGFFPMEDEAGPNLEKAEDMLQKAGYENEREFPSLTVFFDSPRTEFKRQFYRALRRQLDELGIKLNSRYYRSLNEVKRYGKPYLIFLERLLNFPDPEDIIRPLFYSKSISNVINYSNPELDKLLEDAEGERSWTRRVELFNQIEQILFSDVPAIPLFTIQQRIAVQPYVRGIEVPTLSFYYLEARNIWLDK
ncbi:MAG: ABC transporter substrate-binding protein [Candidatus Aminicenantaceae bacterium]